MSRNILESLQNFDLNDLRADDIGNWPLAVRAFLVAALFAGMLGGCYHFLIKPGRENLQRNIAREADLRDQYRAKLRIASNLDRYRQQMIDLNDLLDEMVQQLPSETEMPGLLEEISGAARDSGLALRSITLGDELEQEYFIELPMDIEIVGGYHDLANFINAVAQLPRIVTLHDFNIEQTEGNRLLMKLAARTYRYRQNPEAGS